MKARLFQHIEGQIIGCEVDSSNILEAFEIRGFTFSHINTNHRQRAELQGLPVFNELCGPMWDGGAVRYEDSASNDRFSA